MKKSIIIGNLLLSAIITTGATPLRAQDDTYYFTVNVTPPEHPYNVTGLVVNLAPTSGNGNVESAAINEDHNADFKNLPKGEYLLTIDNAEIRGMENYSKTVSTTGEPEHLYIQMAEYLVTPYDIQATPSLNQDGTFNVRVSWNDEGKYPLPYTYLLQLNGQGAYETSGYVYTFENLQEGDYVITIWGNTPSFSDTEKGEITLKLEKPMQDSSGLCGIEDFRGEKVIYIDVNGNRTTVPDGSAIIKKTRQKNVYVVIER